MIRLLYRKAFILLILFVFFSIPIMASNNQQGISIPSDIPIILTNTAGDILYDNEEGVFRAEGDIHFKSEDFEVFADKIEVFTDTNLVHAEGNPLVIKSAGKTYKGQSIQYNYLEKKGSIKSVSSKISGLSFSGEKIQLIEDNDYRIDKAELTPCIFSEHPHYAIRSRSVMVYPGKKIIARDVWFYFAGYRVFYMPQYTVKFNKDTGKFEGITMIPELGYSFSRGVIFRLTLPYQFSDQFYGEISGEINQSGNKYINMDSKYIVNQNWSVPISYKYKYEESDGSIEKEEYYTGGIRYNTNNLDISAVYKNDLLNNKGSIELDTAYRYQKMAFRYYNKYTDGLLSSKIYSIDYKSRYPVTLQYKKGYSVEYLPFMSIKNLNFKYGGINFKTNIGLGNVANGDNSSKKIKLNLAADKKVTLNKKMGLTLYGNTDTNYYFTDDIRNDTDHYYNYYQLGFKLAGSRDLSNKTEMDYSFSYDYSTDAGTPYLPEDRHDINETIKSSIGFFYSLSEPGSSWKVDLNSTYNLKERELDKVNLNLRRKYDCFSYYLSYGVLDKDFEFGINFDAF